MAQTRRSKTLGAGLTYGGINYTKPVLILSGLCISLIVLRLTPEDHIFPQSISDMFHFAEWLNAGEKWLQAHIRDFTRMISGYIGWFLEQLEFFLWVKPWPVVALGITLPALAYGGLRLALFTFSGVIFWGSMGMWDAAMSTLALMVVSVIFAIGLGVAFGIASSQSNRVEEFFKPVLDTMQTMPAFVYLIPAIFFFGIGGPSAAMAIIIYAMPPVVRLTNLGIRQVPVTMIEAARSFGSTPFQLLWKVQIPQALPSIMMGVNQSIMMALGLAVLATFIGAGGLGEEVWKALRKLKVGWALEGGLCIVFMAIIFDRISIAMSKAEKSASMADPSKMVFRLLPRAWVHFAPACAVEKVLDAVWQLVAATGTRIASAIAYLISTPVGIWNRERALVADGWLKQHGFFTVSLLLLLIILAWDSWITDIGSFPRAWEFTLRGPIDRGIEWLVVEPGFIALTKGIKSFIYLYILNPLDKFCTGLPWWYMILLFYIIVQLSAGFRFALVTVAALLFIAAAGLWETTMYTLAATVTSVAICIMIGLPLGILAAYNKSLNTIMRPILDAMQTMPAFVYLIPVLMFFGGNPVTAIIATVIYALPPMIRMTSLGLRQLPAEINEVSDAFGSTSRQSLIKVKLPMASPSIMLGVNQTVAMALAMQVITPLVAGLGLGKEVFNAMNIADTGKGLVAGAGIVLLAIVLDRLTQAWTKNQREALGL